MRLTTSFSSTLRQRTLLIIHKNFYPGLQGLTKLRYLNLSYNRLIENNVLESLGKLASLEVINFEQTGLSGALQNIAFRNLKNLQDLRLGFNQLSGSIPASLFELPRLQYLDLSYNVLGYNIPVSLSSDILLLIQALKLLLANNLNRMFDLIFFFWKRRHTKKTRPGGERPPHRY